MQFASARIAAVSLALSAVMIPLGASAQAGGTTVHICASCTTAAQIGTEAWNWGRANMGHYQMFIVTNPSPYNLAKCYQRIYYPYYQVDTVVEHPMSSCPNPTPPLT
jgi:hypothetical protein